MKKIFNYFSIFTIVLGTTFANLNSAYADRLIINQGVSILDEDNDGAGIIVELTDAELAGNAVTDVMTIQALTNDDADSTLAIIGSLTVNDSITTTGIDGSDMIITVTDVPTSSLSVGGNITEGGVNGAIQIILDGEEQGLTISGTGVTIDATISAETIGDGILTVTGTATFADEVGYAITTDADKELATITVNGASTFLEEVGAKDININADTTMAKAIEADTIDIVGSTLTASGAVAIAVTTATVIDLDDSTGTAKLILGGALTGSITTDNGEGVLETAAGGSATISGNVGTSAARLSLVTITGDATFSGDIYATTATVASTKVLNTDGATKVVSAEIQGLTDGVGEVEVGGITTFSSNVGTSAKSLAVLDIDAAGTFSGNIDATTITVDATTTVAGTLTATTVTSGGGTANSALTAASDVTVTNYILTGATDTLTLTGSDATVTGTIKAGAVDSRGVIAVNGTKITFASAIGTAGATPDIMTIADGKRAIISKTGNFIDRIDIANGGELEISTDVTSGVVFTTDASMVEADVTGANTKIFMPTNLVGGETLVLFEIVTGATAEADMNVALQDTAITDYAGDFDATDTDQMNVVATAKSATTTASELSVTTNMATALHQANAAAISSGDAAALAAFNNALNAHNGYSATTDTDLTKQVAPQDELISGSTFAAKAMTGTVQGIVSSRMASLRSGDAYFGTGVNAAGEMMSANSGFIQIFGSEAEQDNLTKGSGIQYGYDTQTEGIAIGFDGINDNNSVFGISLSRSTTELTGKGTGSAKNDIDSYTVSLYMDKTTDAGYVEGSLTAGINENVTSRIVNSAGLSRTYKGAYDSSQLSLKIGGGVPKSVGGDAFVTPFGSITGSLINTDAYTETSTTSGDNLRLRIAQDDVNSIVGTVGLKYHNVLSNGGVPMISLALNGELGDKTIDSTNTYQGGGTSFKTSTDVEELSATLGLGYTFNSDRTSVEIAYEADANSEDYLSHYGSFKIVGKF